MLFPVIGSPHALGDAGMTATGNMLLRRFWIEFGPSEEGGGGDLSRSRVYGVTAGTIADALALLQCAVFHDAPLPPVARSIEDVDLAMLDAFHVGPGILPPHRRGIWYPPVGVGQ
jgi:hypothetical protein